MILKKKKKTKIIHVHGLPIVQEEITRVLGHKGWLKFPVYVQNELEDSYLQYKNLGLC